MKDFNITFKIDDHFVMPNCIGIRCNISDLKPDEVTGTIVSGISILKKHENLKKIHIAYHLQASLIDAMTDFTKDQYMEAWFNFLSMDLIGECEKLIKILRKKGL